MPSAKAGIPVFPYASPWERLRAMAFKTFQGGPAGNSPAMVRYTLCMRACGHDAGTALFDAFSFEGGYGLCLKLF